MIYRVVGRSTIMVGFGQELQDVDDSNWMPF